jgi:uncharacterized membrane protein (UPF0127 family)
MTNDERRQILNRAKQLGYPGSILDVFQAYSQGVDVLSDFEREQRAQQIQARQAQQPIVAQTPEEQSQGLIPFHQAGQTDQSMVFPNVKPGQPFTTQGLTAPIDMTKVDNQGNVVESYKAVQPGIANIPTGPYEGTMIETPAKSYLKGGLVKEYQKGGQRKPLILPDDKYGRMGQQAYADSLILYNEGQRADKWFNSIKPLAWSDPKNPVYKAEDFEKLLDTTPENQNKAYLDLKKLNKKDPGEKRVNFKIGFDDLPNESINTYYTKYKKPVQPIEIQKGPQKLTPKEGLLSTSQPELKPNVPLPLSNEAYHTFGSTSTNYAGENKTRFEGNFNLETGEWDIKEKKPIKRKLTLKQPFKEGGAKCYTCGGLKAKVGYNKLGYKK